MTDNQYKLLDCGNQKKLEKFGKYTLIRPCPQAMWNPFAPELWTEADIEFKKTDGEKGQWHFLKKESEGKKPRWQDLEWEVSSPDGILWQIFLNDYGNVGVFTEHWTYLEEIKKLFNPRKKVLNLFTYSGSSAVSLVKDGYKITAVDSSKAAMDTYTYNLGLNNLSRENQRLILEDAIKFTQREVRRGASYGAVMVDAPSFGRGTKKEVFKIEDDLIKLIRACWAVTDKDGYLLITLHSPRFTAGILEVILSQLMPGKKITVRETIQICQSGAKLPSGYFCLIG